MPQMQLPIFAEGVTHLTAELAVERKDGKVSYFNGLMPLFVHDVDDIETFRMITSQFCVNGNVKQMDIVRAFGVPAITVKRAVKKYREGGVSSFYKKRKARKATIMMPEVLVQAQRLLDTGKGVKEVASDIGVNYETLKRAISDGRLKKKS
jgi:transposase